MSVFLKKDYPVKWVRNGDLSVVWAQSQRGLNEGKVKEIAKSFDPDAFGTVAVTLPNGNGVYHVVDGQHRTNAVRRLWGESEMVPCLVLNATNPAEAAEIWLKINQHRTRPQPVDRFRVAVTAGHQAEVEVNDLLKQLGYRIAMGGEDGMISAISGCLAIHKKHGIGGLKDALLVIQGTWGRDRDSVHNNIIRGYADMLGKYKGEVDRGRLVDRVSKQYTPARLIGAAKTAREMFRGTITDNIVRVLVNSYNHGLRAEHRLKEEA